MEKLCVFCKNLEFNAGGHGTYADPASFKCMKRHPIHDDRNSDAFVFDVEDFRKIIVHAENCPDYTEAK